MMIGACENIIDCVLVDSISCGQGEYRLIHACMMGFNMNSR